MEDAEDVPRVHGCAKLTPLTAAADREDEAGVLPVSTGLEALLELSRSVSLQRRDAHLRQGQSPATLLSLQLLDDESLPDHLKLLPDAQLARRQVDIGPLQAGRFTEPQATR